MTEMKSLTVGGKRYDSFHDRKAANTITDTLSGASVSTDLVSSVEHEVACVVSGSPDLAKVKVLQMGKNAIVPKVKSGSMAGVQYTVNDDGSIHVSGTSSSDGIGSFFNLDYVKEQRSIHPGEYVLSGGGTNVRVEVYDKGKTGISVIRREEKRFSISSDATQTYSRLYVSPGVAVDETVYPMARFSGYDSKFEKGVPATQYTPSADGIVSGMISLSPNMTILTDTEGVTIEATYHMDTNKVIAKLSDRIAALEKYHAQI